MGLRDYFGEWVVVLMCERRQCGHWPTWLDLYKNKNYSYRVFVVRDGIWTLA